MATPTAPTGGETLARLRAEAAALQTRAGDLERASAAIESQIAQIAQRGGKSDPKRAERLTQLRQAARETVRLLDDVVRRRSEIRERIVVLERAAAEQAEAQARARVLEERRLAEERRAEEERQREEERLKEEARRLEEARFAAQATNTAPTEAPPPPPDAERAGTSTGGAILSTSPLIPSAPAYSRTSTLPKPAGVATPTREPERPLATKHRLEPVRRRNRLKAAAATLRLRYAISALLSAALIALAALLTPLPELFGWQLFAVQSGSMEPAIPVGAIIAVRPVPAASLKVGDVITFADRNRPELRVTHRIVSLETREGQQVAITKGDANNTTDSWNVPLQSAIGRVVFHVPYAGYVVYWLSSPPVRLAALTLVVVMLVAPAVMRRRVGAGAGSGDSQEPRSYAEMENEIDSLLGDLGSEETRRPESATDPSLTRAAR